MPLTLSGATGLAGLDGSASTPVVQGTDTNTGVFYPAADTVGLSTNGSERMRVDSAGNVGIGTTSPNALYKLTLSGVSGSNGMTIYNSGDANRGGAFVATGASNSGTFAVNTTATGYALTFGVDSTEKMRIDTAGNVGIGTSSPSQKLSVVSANSTTPSRIEIYGDSNHRSYYYSNPVSGAQSAGIGQGGYVSLSSTSTWTGTKSYSGFDSYNLYISNESNKGFHFVKQAAGSTTTDGSITDMMYINSSGNVGISTSSPDNPLHVNGQSTFGSARVSSNSWMSLVFDKSAYFGLVIRQTVSDAGGGQPITFNNVAGTNIGSITSSASNVAYNTSSDYRLKENVQPMNHGLSIVTALKPVTYTWKADGSRGEGFIAHELAEHVPIAVIGEKDAVDDEGNIKPQGVDYSKIVVHLVAAIQELTAKVTALEAKVGA